MAELLRSDRAFQLWSARVGHGELLIRAVKDAQQPTRVDLLFKPVHAMKLKTALDGLVVRDAMPQERSSVFEEVGSVDAENVYIVESGKFVGYVVASVFAFHEDAGEYYEPSHWERSAALPD